MRVWSLCRPYLLGGVLGMSPLTGLDRAVAQTPRGATAAGAAEQAILQALATDPRTAGYSFGISRRGGRLALAGRVGSRVAHDVAIRTAMEVTPSLEDDLIIDTAVQPVAMAQTGVVGVTAAQRMPGPWPNQPATYTTWSLGGQPYTYPMPLFGAIDEPFYGFEPPAISYPPYWGALTAARRAEQAAQVAARPAPRNAPAAPVEAPAAPVANAAPGARPAVEMTIDDDGVATLRGPVPSETVRRKLVEQIAATPGVSRVVDQLTVEAGNAPPNPVARPDVPPPPAPMPPEPVLPDASDPAPRPAAIPAQPRPESAIVAQEIAPRLPADPDRALEQRIARSVTRTLGAALPDLRVTAAGGSVTLGGSVPTLYEAMCVYRAAQQTPGVRQIDDRLRFTVPGLDGPNPLRERGPSEEVEAYLLAQIIRQVGDAAHIDRVDLDGDRLRVEGVLADASGRDRLDAMLRTMPILRGLNVQGAFRSE